MPLFPPFIGGTFVAQSPVAANERTINWYPERIDVPAGKAPLILLPIPGVESLLALPHTSGRGIFLQGTRLFLVADDTLYEIDTSVTPFTATARGTVATDIHRSPVVITGNGDLGRQLFLSASGHGYVYDLTTNTLTEVWPSGCDDCGMLDGFIWSLDIQTSTLWASALGDARTFDAFAQRDLAPDAWRAGVTLRREILLLGEHTSELWYNAGTSPFPFAPSPVGAFSVGIAARRSLARVGDGAMWLAQTRDAKADVVLMAGTQPTSVATHALRYALEQLPRLDDAVADTYEESGHTFYVLTFPSAEQTWVYDLATGLWHERGTWDVSAATYLAWAPMWHAFAAGRHLWLDRLSGHLWRSGPDLSTDTSGLPMRCVRRGPAFWADDARLVFRSFKVIAEAGLGLLGTPPAPGADPQMELRYSHDDGKTWHSAGSRSLGRRGDYRATVEWTRLGQSRSRQFEIVTREPIPVRVIGVVVDAQMGTS